MCNEHIGYFDMHVGYIISSWCIKHNIPFEQRLTIYKTVIRSRLEYGQQIIWFTKEQVSELEYLQANMLKRLLQQYRGYKQTTLLIHDILPLQNRFDILKMQFYIKMKCQTTSLAHKVQQYIKSTPHQHKNSIDMPECYIKKIEKTFDKYGITWKDAFYQLENELDFKLSKELIKNKVKQMAMLVLSIEVPKLASQYNHIYDTHKGQGRPETALVRLTRKYALNAQTNYDKILNSVITNDTHIHDCKPYRLSTPFYDHNLIPDTFTPLCGQAWRTILCSIDGKIPHDQHTCDFCGQPDSYLNLSHRIFKCNQYHEIRNHIFEQFHPILLENLEYYDTSLYTYIENYTNNQPLNDNPQYMTELLDSVIDPDFYNIHNKQLIKQLHSIILLITINIITIHLIKTPKNPLIEITLKNKNKIIVDSIDIINKKIIKTNELIPHSKTMYKTIPRTQCDLPETIKAKLPKFGSANDRKNDPILCTQANSYIIKKQINTQNTIQTYSDGSVRGSTIKFAGCGVFITYKNHMPLLFEYELPGTTSINVAELTGVHNTTTETLTYIKNEFINKSKEIPDITSFCDNQYSVLAINGQYKPNKNHKQLYNKIITNIEKIQKLTKYTLIWIPSHCKNTQHDIADELATQAAKKLQKKSGFRAGSGAIYRVP